jgi:multiple sugar transport system substrate-binding protein
VKTIILTLLLAILLTGCAQANSPQAQPVSFMIFGDLAELAAYQKLVSVYQAKTGAQVELIHIPEQGEYRKRLATDFAAGNPADVVLINYRRIGPYVAAGALQPLDEYLQRSQVIAPDDFYPQALQPFQFQGRLICLPQNLSSLVVYYNQDLFDQAGVAYPQDGWTWGDFLATAQALTRDLDGDGRPDQHGLGFEITLARFAPFIWQHGGEVVNNPYAPTRLALDMPQSLDAIRWLSELQTKYHVTPDAEQAAAEDTESRFMNGRLAMYLNSRRGVPTYREIQGFDWDIAPLPRDARTASLLHADAYCMPASVKDKEAVWRFIEFANSPEGQAIVAASGRTVPSLKAVAESPAFLDPQQKPANSRVFLDMIPYLRALPSAPGWVDVEEVTDNELERIFYGQAPLEKAIRTAAGLAQPYLGETPAP